MSAKQSKKGAKKNLSSPAAAPTGVSSTPAAATVTATTASAGKPADSGAAWIDSTDSRKRTIGKVVLVGVWIYVAALWLLALDQTFHWGIFGPKIPPVP